MKILYTLILGFSLLQISSQTKTLKNTRWKVIDAGYSIKNNDNGKSREGFKTEGINDLVKSKFMNIKLEIKKDSIFMEKNNVILNKAKITDIDNNTLKFSQGNEIFIYKYEFIDDNKCRFTLKNGNFLLASKLN
jgi:hypothetical protein